MGAQRLPQRPAPAGDHLQSFGRALDAMCTPIVVSLAACPPPAGTLERLEQLPQGQIVYCFRKPQPYGGAELCLASVESIIRLAALISPPRICTSLRGAHERTIGEC